MVWLLRYFPLYLIYMTPSEILHFVRMGNGEQVGMPDEHMIQLMLDKVILNRRVIQEREGPSDITLQAHFKL